MKPKILGLISVVLLGVCGVASSSIVYNVDITDGTETVSGTITTDGNTGALAAGDIDRPLSRLLASPLQR